MKKQKSRPQQDTLLTALQSDFAIDKRRLVVLVALILAVIQARTSVLYSLKTHVDLPGSQEVRYQRLLRFVQFCFPEGTFTRFAVKRLPPSPVDLILDRTNWKLGSKDINILILSAAWNGFSLPLVWEVLSHSGNSSHVHRSRLLERFLSACPEVKIRSLIADREFFGKEWFKVLKEKRISPCIRLKSDAKLGNHGLPISAYFKKLQYGEIRYLREGMPIYGVKYRVGATLSPSGEVVYLAYTGHAKQNFLRYAERWQAENFHSALKTRGFNLEDTGLTCPERVASLLTVIAIAFIWACQTGELLAKKVKRKIKNHGYAAISIFRLGLDYLQDLLLHPYKLSGKGLKELMIAF